MLCLCDSCFHIHVFLFFFFFFFSSRRRHTRFDCDWSSDVCSSDLKLLASRLANSLRKVSIGPPPRRTCLEQRDDRIGGRSEERRVGKECRSRWSTYD